MMSHKYLLDGHETVPTDDLELWARRLELDNRIVAITHLGRCRISTVFLGLDHNFGHGPPLLFETMAFDEESGRWLDIQEWCSTWSQAEDQHARVVASLTG
jgi:hypothetical protein